MLLQRYDSLTLCFNLKPLCETGEINGKFSMIDIYRNGLIQSVDHRTHFTFEKIYEELALVWVEDPVFPDSGIHVFHQLFRVILTPGGG